MGLLWWSSDWGSVLPLQGAWVQSLVRELGFHILQSEAKKEKKKQKKKKKKNPEKDNLLQEWISGLFIERQTQMVLNKSWSTSLIKEK